MKPEFGDLKKYFIEYFNYSLVYYITSYFLLPTLSSFMKFFIYSNIFERQLTFQHEKIFNLEKLDASKANYA